MQEFLLALRRGGVVGIERKPQGEGRPPSLLALGLDSTAVMVHDKIAGHQVDAVFHGTVAADHEWIEYQPQGLLGQTWPVIFNLHLDFRSVRLGALRSEERRVGKE